ncbi:MAG: sn-glycerol-3-phosphate ABC transporter ATP-binding protein UgpC [Candidatus Marinimicrobia bacterium]|jgi:multiple sugar transport system ATP-binding protein|nr:sn-glycerol-3-phosphate ABC transporter ATP-binding protein UgpC [Candidatus Neomarinimicrobiota bacterium]MBT4852834.1 sn-glycerol-3-phosphate ABC transporter ATP-binding protein UgpC [Candidatus Neomarinimicrobiota bacterium]MBT6217651.1 sn-glycerol-3-phosphate ABC transporter ATP-binding protein UgpC [Candidatus Neomarinimicrobiota bacterium]
MASISIKNLDKTFGKDVRVIQNFNLEIVDGEFIVMVGPSGCGKSTLLRIIAGLEDLTAGEVFIGNDIVNEIPAKKRNIAMVFQNYALYPHMNVYQNLAFGLKLRKFPKPEIEKIISETAAILEIEELLSRKPKALSGGQRQRVALGRAIVRDPQVFLFDEPLSNLDAKLRLQMRTEIKKLHDRLKTTMVYVTHDQVEAMTMGDRIAILKDGVIQQLGTPQEVFSRPTNIFVGSFIGSPPMNFISGNIQNNKFINEIMEIELIDVKVGKSAEGSKVTLGIRPGDIALNDEGIHLKLIASELLGDETILHLSAGDDTILVKLPSIYNAKIGDEIGVRFNLSEIHLFNSKGKRISN